MELIVIFAAVLGLMLILRPMGINEPNVVNEFIPPFLAKPGYNFNVASATAPISPILHASVVCRDLDQSVVGDVIETARRQMLGITYPARTNMMRVAGIYSAWPAQRSNRNLAYQQGCEVLEAGLGYCRVYVPPLTVLAAGIPAGTHLVVGNEYNLTTNKVDFIKTITAVAHSGVLEPVLWSVADAEHIRAELYPAANPVAILREAVTGHATLYQIQTVLVEVIGPHRPLPFSAQFNIHTLDGDVLKRVLFRALGPGVITGVIAQQGTTGTTSGGCAVDVIIDPWGEWDGAAESKSVFQAGESIYIPHDCDDTHRPIFGCGCDLNGDIDPDNDDTYLEWGTLERQGLLEADEYKRQFPTASHVSVKLTEDSGAGTPLDLVVNVEGIWY